LKKDNWQKQVEVYKFVRNKLSCNFMYPNYKLYFPSLGRGQDNFS
jgi:hypothetical protein